MESSLAREEIFEIEQNELAGKYLTFSLNGEEYGIGILQVREIIGVMPVTSVPRTPSFVKGVINLRGKVIPIVDLRLKFGLPEADCTDRTSVVVVDAYSRVGRVQIGIVVDHVSEVVNVTGDQIEAPPEFGASVDTGYILGMAKTERDVKILLDMDRVLSVEQMVVLDQA